MKASIKRPSQSISQALRIALPAISEDSEKNVVYSIDIKGKEEKLWPSHLAGVYISDRIKDIKSERNNENVNVVISVSVFFLYDRRFPLILRTTSWLIF